MKIVFIGDLPPYNKGGVGTYVKYVSYELSKYAEVHVISAGKTNKTIKRGNLTYYFISSPLRSKKNNHLNAKMNAIQQDFLKAILSRKIKNVDIIHANTIFLPFHHLFPKRSKLVITVHGDPLYEATHQRAHLKEKSIGYKITYSLIKSTLKQADCIIYVSDNLRKRIIKSYDDENNTYVIPNGFDSKIFKEIHQQQARKDLSIPLNRKVLLTVGNLVEIKGHKYLINALKKVVEVEKNILLILVGSGPLENDLKKLVRKLNLQNNVWLVGAKPHSEIPLWMNAADLFMLPSLNEGNPTVMFEALGVGLPFVGTEVGGVPEIITSEDYGLLCPPADSVCLAEKILMALDKEWSREKIIKYAQQFTWENIAKEILKVYEKVMR